MADALPTLAALLTQHGLCLPGSGEIDAANLRLLSFDAPAAGAAPATPLLTDLAARHQLTVARLELLVRASSRAARFSPLCADAHAIAHASSKMLAMRRGSSSSSRCHSW